MTATLSNIVTEQEYLQMEENSGVRHEFINGKLYEMPGGTSFHEKVIINILRFLLRHTSLEVFAQGMRVQPPDTQDYFYPDTIVTNPVTTKVITVNEPILLLEVLSPSTKVNDLTDKFIAYRRFPTLAYYLLAEPDFCRITLFFKGENNNWESEEYSQLTDVISLNKININLPVSDIYAGLVWLKR